AAALTNLADVLLAAGRPQESADAATRALVTARRTGSERVRAYASTNLGNALVALGQEGAVARHEEALALSRTMGDRHLEGSVLNSLGAALLGVRDVEGARTRHRAALAIALQLGDSFEEGRAHDGLAACGEATQGA
ncbi:tetratricopeptide repeat protein, partial [Actinotalea sp. C106]|uniref:tetratricopeptide repeat protein n=1 Tax=Actinotalea sp. C106 TaxID=2908644 RepID=UPI002027C79E